MDRDEAHSEGFYVEGMRILQDCSLFKNRS